MQQRTRCFLVLLMIAIFITGCSYSGSSGSGSGDVQTASPEQAAIIPGSELLVHFIDVGQGDAILIQCPGGENILVDGGERGSSDDLIAFLDSKNIKSFEAIIASHPHSDHIGGLQPVLQHYQVKKVYMPKVAHTSNTYLHLLDEIEQQGLKISPARAGVTIQLKNIQAEFLAPSADEYEGLNNYSAVLRIQYGQTAFLLTGDAEELSEKEMLAKYKDLEATVLKVGHHGSTSSTSEEFLQSVSPQLAIISCGANNDYGHPHREIMQRLQQKGIKIYRTDLCGTVSVESNGKSVSVLTTKQDKATSPAKDNKAACIGNKKSGVYHTDQCTQLPAQQNRVYFSSPQEAEKAGYRACKNCTAGGNSNAGN